MSNVLMIRHLPLNLSLSEKEQLLKHFGAEKVWQSSKKRNYVFASFANVEMAKSSLMRLHQLEIAQRRLVVEYSFEKEPVISSKQDTAESSMKTKHVKEFLRSLNAWNPTVDFYQPPPAHIKYKYPNITPKIIVNLIFALYQHKPFYIQCLHLMNKMCLDLPFQDNENSLHFFKKNFREFFLDEIAPIPIEESEPESEISGDENEKLTQPTQLLVKRKHRLPITKKRAAAVLATASIPKTKKVKITEQVFDTVVPIQEAKKIAVVVSHDALQKRNEEPVNIGEIGKLQKEEKVEQEIERMSEPEPPPITKKELLKNKISYRDMKLLPVFKNYHPGEPSMRLYIKNLAKSVTELDVRRIYKRYIKESEDDQIGFDVRVMQEGRMKGQAFVTFPSVEIAEVALNETNGFMLKEKPIVVQFARIANKKRIDYVMSITYL